MGCRAYISYAINLEDVPEFASVKKPITTFRLELSNESFLTIYNECPSFEKPSKIKARHILGMD